MSRLLVIATAMTAGSLHAQEAKPAEEKTTFQDDVFPILEDACLNCHNPDETKGGLDLSTYGAAMEGGSGGEIVNAGDPASSRMLLTALHREEPFMPPKKPMLDKTRLDTLTKWIEGGLLDNPNSKPRKKSTPDFAMTLSESPAGKPEGPPPMPENLLLEPSVVANRAGAVLSVATSPWAPVVALTGQKQVLLYHTGNLRLLGALPFPEGFPETVSFSRNGSLVLAGGGIGGKSGRAVAWDLKTGERVIEVGSEFDTVLAADIRPDQSQVALGGPGRNIKIFDTRSGEQLFSLKKHPDWLLELAYSPNGKFLASGGRSGALYIWDPPKGIEFFTLKGHTKAVTGLSWRDDSKVLASCGEDDQVILWELREGKQIKKWNSGGGGVTSIHFDHKGNLVVSGRDKKIRVYDQAGKALKTIDSFTDVALASAFTHDDKRIIGADWTGKVTAFDVETAKAVGNLDANPPLIADRLAALEHRKTAIVAELEAAKKAHAAAVAKKTGLDKRRTDIRATVPALQADVKKQDAAVVALPKTIATLTSQLDQFKKAVAAREQQLPKLAAATQQAQQKHTALTGQLNEWKKKLAAQTPPPKPAPPAAKPKPPTPAPPAKTVSKTTTSTTDAAPTTAPPTDGGKRSVVSQTPAAKPTPKPAPAKPKTTPTPAPAAAPKPVAVPATKPTPQPKPAPAPAPQQKINQLNAELKTATDALNKAKAAEAALRKVLDAEKAKRDAVTKDLQAKQSQLAAAKKATPELKARIAKLQEEDKGLEPTLKEAAAAVAPADAKVKALLAEQGRLPGEIAFWTAAHFQVEVVNERARLTEMELEFSESPSAADRAALQRQKLKVQAVEELHASLRAGAKS